MDTFYNFKLDLEPNIIDMIYDLPFNSYNRIQQNGGSSQLYIESMNLFLNAFYEPSFNGDFTFKVKGIVEWTNPSTEPWNIAGNPGYEQYRDTIGTYYKNNHNLQKIYILNYIAQLFLQKYFL